MLSTTLFKVQLELNEVEHTLHPYSWTQQNIKHPCTIGENPGKTPRFSHLLFPSGAFIPEGY